MTPGKDNQLCCMLSCAVPHCSSETIAILGSSSELLQGQCSLLLLKNPRAGAGVPRAWRPGLPVAHLLWGVISGELLGAGLQQRKSGSLRWLINPSPAGDHIPAFTP